MTRADIITLLAALMLVPYLYIHFWTPTTPGKLARVFVGETLFAEYDLSTPQQIRVPGVLGDSILEIADGGIRFIQSPCRDKVCILAGWQRRGGEFAACLPNQISIHVVGGISQFDTFSF